MLKLHRKITPKNIKKVVRLIIIGLFEKLTKCYPFFIFDSVSSISEPLNIGREKFKECVCT